MFEKFARIWIEHGHTGVSLFLVLSAFLFTLICAAGEKQIVYWKFIYNRVLRIFPLLTLVIFAVITVNRANSSPLDILRVFTLQLNTGNPDTGWGQEYFPSGPIWTIAVEFQFYLLFPFLICFYAKYGKKYLFLLILMMMMFRGMIVFLNDRWIYYNLYHSIVGRIDQFIIGILFGVLYIEKVFTKNRLILLSLIILSIVSLTFILKYNIPAEQNKFLSSVIDFPLEAVFYGIIIVSYLMIEIPSNKLGAGVSKFFAWLGGLSFSIYLLHLPVAMIVSDLLGLSEPNNLAESIGNNLIRLPFIIVMAALSFYSIEKPFMSLRTKYFKE
jgi:acyltransferase 3